MRKVGADGDVKVTVSPNQSPERLRAAGAGGGGSRSSSAPSSVFGAQLRQRATEAQQTEAEMQDIFATLEAMEAAVGAGVAGGAGGPTRAQRSVASQQVEQRSKDIAETQNFLAEMRAAIEELSEIQEQANTIRRIAVEQTAQAAPPAQAPPAQAPPASRRAAEEHEALEQELAPLEPLFEAAGVTLRHRTNILNIFRVAAGGADSLGLDGFTDVMVWLHVPREYSRQYFKAFDLDNDGALDFREFLLGLIAMDPTTSHDGMWAEMRARYIFRTYDVDENRQLDLAELTHLVRHLRRGRGDSTRPHEIEAEAVGVMDLLCDETEDEVSFDAFLSALPPFGDVLGGTTVLFRLGTPTSPKEVDITTATDEAADDEYDAMHTSRDWTDSESNDRGSTGVHPAQSDAEHPGSVSRTDSAMSMRSALAGSDGVRDALQEERVRLDDLRLALRFCQSMSGDERTAFLREFFQEFQADTETEDEGDEGNMHAEENVSEDYEVGEYEFGDGVFGEAESALDLENYNWVADPGPHPGVRGLGSDTASGASEHPTGAPPRAHAAQGNTSMRDHAERVDSVLGEFEEVMDGDPSTVDFLNLLVSELKTVDGHDQQSQVLAAVRNTLVRTERDIDGGEMGSISTGMGIAAELLGTQQGDRLPSRRGRRAKLSGTVADTDLRPDFRPGSAPSGQTSGLRGADPTARPTSADGHRSFINSSFPTPDVTGHTSQVTRPAFGASNSGSSSLSEDDGEGAQAAAHSGAYDYVETAESASSVSTASSYYDEERGEGPTSENTFVEAIQACTDGRHESSEISDDRGGVDSADDSSADQSGYSYTSSDSDPSSSSTTQMNILTQEYSSEIRRNEAVGYELSNVLSTLIEAGKSLNEVAAQGVESVILTTQHLEMVAQRIMAVAEGQQSNFDARLRKTILTVHLKYAGMDSIAYKDTLVQEVSDILYDEMIFNKVLQQVENSYDEDLGTLHQHIRPGEEISDELRGELQQLLEQRHNDLHRLHQEREKRLLAKQQPAPAAARSRARPQDEETQSERTTTRMTQLSQMEPDTSDTSENEEPDENSSDDDPPIEVFSMRAADTATDVDADAVSNDSDGLGSWSAESDPGRSSQVDDMHTHGPVTIDDLPQESLLGEAAAGANPSHGAAEADTSSPSVQAVDLVVKIDEARKQELLKMMEEEQRERFPADTLRLPGSDDLDILPDGSSPSLTTGTVSATTVVPTDEAKAEADNQGTPPPATDATDGTAAATTTPTSATTVSNDGRSQIEPSQQPGGENGCHLSAEASTASGQTSSSSSGHGSGGHNVSPDDEGGGLSKKIWGLAELESDSAVSKKMLLSYLKENSSSELLKKHGLSGAFKNVMKKRTREDLVTAYKGYLASAGAVDAQEAV